MDKNIIYEDFEEQAQIIYVEGVENKTGQIVIPAIDEDNPYTTYEYVQLHSSSRKQGIQTFDEQQIEDINDSIEHKTNDYICGSCDDSFARRIDLDLHLRKKHPDIYNIISNYRKEDPKNVSTIRSVHLVDTTQKNLMVKSEQSLFICKCGEKYIRFLELEQHVQINHVDELELISEDANELQDEDYDIIEEEDVDPETIDVHSSTVPDSIESSDIKLDHFISDGNTSFVTMDELISKRVSGSKGTTVVRGGHVCHNCGTKFWLKKNFLTHMREKHPDKPEYMCDVCSKGFFDHLQLREHKRIHDTKKFVCDICSKGFSTKSKLTIHLDVHFRRNTVDCEICGKTFAAKSGYRVHLKKHLGMWEKKLACSICDARFRYDYHLNIHMKSHSGEKNHFCEICNKGFALPRQLQAHMDGHNNVRRYKCENCSQTFIRRQTWRRHLITHTGEKAYKCEICGVAYVDRRTLRRHLEKVHPGTDIQAFSKPIHAVPVVVDESMTIADLKSFI